MIHSWFRYSPDVPGSIWRGTFISLWNVSWSNDKSVITIAIANYSGDILYNDVSYIYVIETFE